MDELVIPFVQELSRRLPVRGSDCSQGHDGSEGEGKDDPAGKAMWSPHRGDQDDNTPGKDGKFSFEWFLTWQYFGCMITGIWFFKFPLAQIMNFIESF